ncbi:MAG: LytTR family DNA-binding domain-containing protein [Paludibacter sp.]|nr:LytTR family DNA-binding domain-containing protein [Paludibacter sp.]
MRVHRSHIVNVEFISRIELHEKQNQQLTLKNGHKIKVSQQGYKTLRQKLKL